MMQQPAGLSPIVTRPAPPPPQPNHGSSSPPLEAAAVADGSNQEQQQQQRPHSPLATPLDEVELQARGSPRCCRARSLSRSRSLSVSYDGGFANSDDHYSHQHQPQQQPQSVNNTSGELSRFGSTQLHVARTSSPAGLGGSPTAPTATATRRLSGSLLPPVVRLVPLATISQSQDGSSARSSGGGGEGARRVSDTSQAHAAGASAHSHPPSAAKGSVRFGRYAEQLEFEQAGGPGGSDDSSVISFTEEQLLEAQGEGEITTYSAAAGPDGYDYTTALLPAAEGVEARSEGAEQQQQQAISVVDESSINGAFEEVALSKAAASRQAAAAAQATAEYRLRLITGDRLSAGLASGQRIWVEIQGPEGSFSQELPRAKGSFARGCVDTFTLKVKRLGRVEWLRVWHEPDGPALAGRWSLEAIELEDRHRGELYRFVNPAKEGWLFRGKRNALTMRPRHVGRLDDETEAFTLQMEELRRQLATNEQLGEDERTRLAGRLAGLQAQLQQKGGGGGGGGGVGRGKGQRM